MKAAERNFLVSHDVHNYAAVMERWGTVAEQAGWEAVILAEQGGYPVVGFRSQAAWDDDKGLYVSAGVHGDEPAGVWGLLEWAEANVRLLSQRSVLVLPCFNPWGLTGNQRSDHDGRDLNRRFNKPLPPLLKAWRKFVGKRKFRLALNLHEDYDAQGIYLYELGRRGGDFGRQILTQCEPIIPIQPGAEIDGSPFKNGLLVRKRNFDTIADKKLEAGGVPEAIFLRMNCAQVALTFETPSEFSLYDRVRAQRRFLEAAVQLVAP